MRNQKPAQRIFAARVNPVTAGVAAAVGTMLVAPVVAVAQDEVEVTGDFFEEIVVTSTRRESAAQDVPYNIAAFTGATLEKQRISNLGEFARWVPGLTLTDQGARDSSLLTVRGLNASQLGAPESVYGNSSGNTVGTYLGEVPLYVDLKPYDLDRVEVLIGPQGTLYGAGTLAGAVRYIPNKPDASQLTLDTHANLHTKSHSDDFGYEADAVINIPLIEGELAFRGLVGYIEDAGFVDYDFLVANPGVSNPEDPADLVSKRDANVEETLSLRASLLWNMTDAAELMYSYFYQNQDSGGRTITHQTGNGTGPYVSAHRYLEPNERENQLHSLLLDWDFGAVEWVSSAGYSTFEDDGQRDQTDLLLDFMFGYETFPSFAAFTSETSGGTDILSLETRVVSNYDSPVNFIAGAFWYDEDTDNDASREFAPGYPEFGCDNGLITACPPPLPFGDLEYINIQESTAEERALFGELNVDLTDRWKAAFGLRWFEYEVTVATATSFVFFDPDLAGLSDVSSDLTKDDDVIFRINTSYELDGLVPNMDSGTAYFTFSQGYRIGGFNFVEPCEDPLPAGPNACALPNEREYKNDTTDNYEIGLKSTWLDNRLTVNTSLYYIEWKDAQVDTITVNGSIPVTANATETENLGLELALRAQLTDELAMYATYAAGSAELARDSVGVIGTRAGNIDAFKGDRLPGTPEQQGSLLINWSRPLPNGTILDVDYGFTTISDVVTKIGARGAGETLGGFTVHNLSASVEDGQLTTTVYVDNLFDKFARTGVRGDTDFIDTVGLFPLRRYYHDIIQPRTIGVDFRYSFDIR